MRIGHSIVAVSLLPSVAGAAITPTHLAPSSPWVVDYAENSCRLVRRFGEGEDMTILAMESEGPGALDMIITGKPLASDAGEVAAMFLPVQSKPRIAGLVGRSTDKFTPMLLFSTVYLLPDNALLAQMQEYARRYSHPDVRPPTVSIAEKAARQAQREAFATNTTALELDVRRDRTVVLDTGSIGGPIKAFDKCSRDSLRDWGVDPDVEDRIVRPVWTPNPMAWFKSSDYPQDMLVFGRISDVKVRALVDSAGHVTKCTSLSHFKDEVFNKIVCDRFIARAHFEPAELADGTKVPSYYVSQVKFRIEN